LSLLSEQSPAEIESRIAPDVSRITNWFDHEYYCGLDVYSQPFDEAAGYAIVENDRIRVFLYRHSKLEHCWFAFSSFVGSDLPWLKVNATLDKAISKDYLSFINAIRLRHPFLESVYSTRYARPKYRT
jgi:hypothetical protein